MSLTLSPRAQIKAWFEEQDLIFLGVVRLQTEREYENYRKWVDEGRQAGMAYLTRNQELRENPNGLFPEAKVALVFALAYFQGDTIGEGPSPRIAQYARFKDYHRLLRERASEVLGRMRQRWPGVLGRVAVDSAPILERALAVRTEKGFIGKNTCYIHPEKGSFLLLGEVLSSLDLPPDEKVEVDPWSHKSEGGCGICDRCQVRCPTGALNTDYSIDSNLCLSYWTIEHRGVIPERFWPHLKDYVFGCDICQLVCPYNKKDLPQLPASIAKRTYPSLFEIATMSQAAYETHFGGTPLTRAKRNGLRRNALIAMAVTADPHLTEAMSLARQDSESPIQETLGQLEQFLSNSAPRD